MNKRDRLILMIPAFWTSLFDITITITHQTNEYWKGDLSKANEGNPIGAFFMAKHISGIFIISIIWLILIAILGYYLPRKISRVFLLFTLIAHSYGASTWLSNNYGFWYALSLILFNSILFYVVGDLVIHETRRDLTK
jgi:uncharacterized sodium:solute symporter family permease YidK